MAAPRHDGSPYYGWFIVAACFTAMLCFGEVMWSLGVFFKALEGAFGWSRSLTSSGYTVLIVGNAVGAIVAGRLTDRYTARPVFIASALLAGPAIALCSTIQTILQFQGLLFVAGLGAGALLSAPASTVQRWFHGRKNSGIALALVMSGVGVGALIFAPFINYLIESTGWRQAFIVAGVFFLVAVGSAGLVIRQLPTPHSTVVGAPRQKLKTVASRYLVSSPEFLLIAGSMGVSVFGFQIVNVHIVPFATDVGISAATAAAALGLMGAFSVVGRMGCGMLAGRFGWGKTYALAQVGVGLAMLLLLVTNQVLVLYCVVGLYGFSQGVRAVAVAGTMGRVFGMHALGELIGIMMAFGQLVGAVGPYAAGYTHDVLGSYRLIFMILGVTFLVVAVLIHRILGGTVTKSSERPEVEQPV